MSPALARFVAARSDVSARASDGAGMMRCWELSRLLDEALIEMAGDSPAFAVVAVGGSGRREQCRHSDIDVMVLVSRDGDGEALRALYPLWDAQLKVGHSVRTPQQAIGAAEARLETFTALLDGRFVCGDRKLFEQFSTERQRLVRAKRTWLRSELSTHRERRREREPWQLMAVDLKLSRGGLRDLQSMHWLRVAERLARGEPAEPPGLETEAPLDRLLATRNALHAFSNRPSDVFRPDVTAAVGEWLGVSGFEWARDLYAAMRRADADADEGLRVASPSHRWLPWPRRPDPVSEVPAERLDGLTDLERLVAALEATVGGGELDPMPQARWLERLLPEWEVLRNRPHIAPFHVNPVDVHVMRAVAEAKKVMERDDFDTASPRVARAFGRPVEVLLATFLHDIGKGHEGDHSEAGGVIAERFATRAGLEPELRHRLVTAVREHLLLPAIATRRDIADEQVIRETARRVGSVEVLQLLYLISIADARASGPNVWSAWKAQLMRTLYERVFTLLASGSTDGGVSADRVVETLVSRFPESVVRDHLESLGATYLLSTAPSTIGDHLALVKEAGKGTATSLDRFGEFDRLTIATRDRPGLLQAVAGTLAGHNATVLGGVAYTRDDGVALQVWHVRDALGLYIEDRRWERLLRAVPQAIDGTFAVDQRLAQVRSAYPDATRVAVPVSIHFDNRSSRDYSIVEVSTADRRGLLYAITSVFHDLGVDIHLAKVDTIGPEVMDAFYVLRNDGKRIEASDEMERVIRRITEAIARLDT